MIGSLPDEASAQRFVDYLLTRQIHASAESNGRDDAAANWQIWVEHDDHLDPAKAELAAFAAAPGDAKYDSAADAARLRKDADRAAVKRRERHIDVRTAGARTTGRTPVVAAFIAVCVGLFLLGATNEATRDNLRAALVFDDPAAAPWETQQPRSMFASVMEGQVWRVFTPALLHGGFLHLLFNMYWVFLLGGMIEARKGPLKMLGLIVTTAVVSNVLQAAWYGVSPFEPAKWAVFLGASGVVSGLLGYAWMKGRYRAYEGIGVDRQTLGIMIGWIVICSLGLVRDVANVAHWAGLVCGMVIALVPVWKRKLSR